MVFKTKSEEMKKVKLTQKLMTLGIIALFLTMCAPPQTVDQESNEEEAARLDSIRKVRCPRLFSSAAEYYKNKDWESTVRVYNELVELGCDYENPEEVYLYYAIAFEYMGRYDSSEYVLLRGLQVLPDNVDLRKRLAYSYKKQGKIEDEINEYDRLSYLAPEDIDIKTELAKLYGEQKRYDDQIAVLKDLLKLDPSNEAAQGDLARAYELSGRDPLEVYGERFEKNPDNVSYGLDYADRLLNADRASDAIDVLNQVLQVDPSSKVAYRKLASAYDQADRLEDAANAYQEVFKLDPRDFRVAIKISEVYIENQDFPSAFTWADKAVTISDNGEAYGAKGNVYYKSFQTCRTGDISIDDRIVATLAYQLFSKAEEKGFTRFHSSMDWLKENEVLFGKAQWFMIDADKKNKGYVKPEGSCYGWVNERLEKDPSW
jgi:tetratricopeptide (TPR) repeat protein